MAVKSESHDPHPTPAKSKTGKVSSQRHGSPCSTIAECTFSKLKSVPRFQDVVLAAVRDEEICAPPSLVQFHAWESDYSKSNTRDRYIKPMTKDSYTPDPRSIMQTANEVEVEGECQDQLAPPSELKIRSVKIKLAPRCACIDLASVVVSRSDSCLL